MLRDVDWSTHPHAPGGAPFRIKGVAYRDTIARHEALRGGVAALRRELPTEPLRRFYDGPFTAGGWYDVFPMVSIDAAAARLRGQSFEQSLREGTRAQAHAVLNGVYRTMLTLFSPTASAWALPRASATYFDFGETTTSRAGPQRVEGLCKGVPSAIADWFSLSCLEFALVALELSGAREPRLQWLPPRGAGVRAGLPVVDLRFELRWSP